MDVESGASETDQGWSSGGSVTSPQPWLKACDRRITLIDKEGSHNEAMATGSPRLGGGTRGSQGAKFKGTLSLRSVQELILYLQWLESESFLKFCASVVLFAFLIPILPLLIFNIINISISIYKHSM